MWALETLQRGRGSIRALSLLPLGGNDAAAIHQLEWIDRVTENEAEIVLACLSLDADYLTTAGDESDALRSALGDDRWFTASVLWTSRESVNGQHQ
ncbi:MAG: hypothetical protein Q8K58_09110 [Acidimicrobiales bacterium]|nr:hypothetical protein [Acidimicrobiales bacterium]